MGLLGSLEKKKNEIEVPENAMFEYTSMDNQVQERVVTLYRRVFMRGTLGNEEQYNSTNNICLIDKYNKMLAFEQGICGEDYYYGLFINDEFWTIICKRAEALGGNKLTTDVSVEYLPSKIGKVSTVDGAVTEIASLACRLFEEANIEKYKEGIKSVFADDSYDDYTVMKNNWFEKIMESEQCKQLYEYKQSLKNVKKIDDEELKTEHRIMNEEELAALNLLINNRIKSIRFTNFSKVFIVENENDIKCYKLLKKLDYVSDDKIQYYVVLINSSVVVVATTEEPSIEKINIMKITMSNVSAFNSEALTQMICEIIKQYEKVHYYSPIVEAAKELYIEDISSGTEIELK